MPEPRGIPIGARLELVERRRDGTYAPWLRDPWPDHETDPALNFVESHENWVHAAIQLAIGDGQHAEVLGLMPSGGDISAYVELDDHDQPLVPTARGIEAVRLADRLHADIDSKELAALVVDFGIGESRAMRFALLDRLVRSFMHQGRDVPGVLFRLAPWELVNDNLDELVAGLDGGRAEGHTLLRHFFAHAAPGLTRALTDLRRSIESGGPGDRELFAVGGAMAAIPHDGAPDETVQRLLVLVERLRSFAHSEALTAVLDQAVLHLSPEDAQRVRTDNVLLDQFRDLLKHASTRRPITLAGAWLTPAEVRAPDSDAGARPVELRLHANAVDVLGSDVQTHAVQSAGHLSLWMTRLSRVSPGTGVTVAALTPEGELSTAHGIAEGDPPGVALELPWAGPEPPEEVAFAIG